MPRYQTDIDEIQARQSTIAELERVLGNTIGHDPAADDRRIRRQIRYHETRIAALCGPRENV